MNRLPYIYLILAALIGQFSPSALSQDGRVITIRLVGIALSPDASGTVQVIGNPQGPDKAFGQEASHSRKLYFSLGACSLSPHIVARELEIPIDLDRST